MRTETAPGQPGQPDDEDEQLVCLTAVLAFAMPVTAGCDEVLGAANDMLAPLTGLTAPDSELLGFTVLGAPALPEMTVAQYLGEIGASAPVLPAAADSGEAQRREAEDGDAFECAEENKQALRCPACGSEQRFRIAATVWVWVSGADSLDVLSEGGERDYGTEDACGCSGCGHQARLGDFYKQADG